MNESYVRKMASVQRIDAIHPIPGADTICQYQILGWKIIDQINKYKIGDLIIACVIDSWIPTRIAPFLTKLDRFPKEYNGVPGEKLRTIKLRGALSQGLILPLSVCDMIESELMIGLDVTYPLGIQKWEPPPEVLNADTKGSFPSYGRKSDQERIQNCYPNIAEIAADYSWQISEKVEGQSASFIFYNGEYSVCSRNLLLKESNNAFWNTSRKYDLENKMRSLGANIQITGEQTGIGISGNIYKMQDHRLYVFDIFDIDRQEYLTPQETQNLIALLGLESVPILDSVANIDGVTLDQFLDRADGKSVLGTIGCLREGLVYKANSTKRVSFKTVSNKYLLNMKD